MSNLVLDHQWHSTINQVETTDAIKGGASGVANLAPRQLAENIFWLKEDVEDKFDLIKPLVSILGDTGSFALKMIGADGEYQDVFIKYGQQLVQNSETVNFNSAFPTACLQVVVSQTNSTGTVHAMSTSNPTKENFIAHHEYTNPITVAYIAIGH